MSEARDNLVEKLKQASINKQQTKTQQECEHDYKTFKETLQPDNDKFTGRAHFIVKGCLKCHDKKRVDYIVE